MQLKKPRSIRNTLALATSSMLLGVSQSATADTDSPWEVDTSVLYYSEADRVTAIEPVIRARKEIGDDEFLTFRLVADSLTGSSANGAIPQATAQTFTSPSGAATYTTPANQTPLDPSFHDTRGALNAEWELPLSERLKGIFSANYSTEYDYTSMGAAGTLSWDMNNRNTTLTAGLSYNLDTVKPVGGMPLGLSAMPTTTAVQKSSIGSTDDKTVMDLLFGVTQVIDRNTLMQFNFSYGQDDGYLTDPYKILSVVDNTGVIRGTDPYLYEKRPDSRSRQAFYWKTVHQFNEDVLNASYRYYWDDWGISSHTIDVKYRSELGGGHYLQPRVRYYLQDKADFYYYSLTDGQPLPQYASADYRLADMSTTTLGLKYGVELGDNSEFSIRAEMMKQKSEGDAPFEDVDANILVLSYSFLF